ncbi:hypothetical protein CXB51_025478 [Gossypium anomalum]|uniref:Transposase MuDR plant domain-containing protein n=1 Tax=Gossypium anomalum TaxID=47600 RepID=A0A8J5Y1Z5_9ROSI|nr:hypothetical protein CXB51_025478 [Gossypium anomalum]
MAILYNPILVTETGYGCYTRLEIGMIFESPNQFKKALSAYVVHHIFDFKLATNENFRTRAKCKAQECPWMIYATKDNEDGCFKIIPRLKLFDMQRLAKEEFKVELNKNVYQRARSWAIEHIRDSLEYEFNHLFDYVFALRSVYPNGNFDLLVVRPIPTENPKLGGSFKGELLAAVGRDGNNQIFLIVWAIVEVENKESWAWFLKYVQLDLEVGDGKGFITFEASSDIGDHLEPSSHYRLLVVDDVESNAPAPTQGEAPVDSRPILSSQGGEAVTVLI